MKHMALLAALAVGAMMAVPTPAGAAAPPKPNHSYVLGANGVTPLVGAPELHPYADGKRKSVAQIEAMARAWQQKVARVPNPRGATARSAIVSGSVNYLLRSDVGCYTMDGRASQLQQLVSGSHGVVDPFPVSMWGDCPDYTRAGGEDDIGYTANVTLRSGGGWVVCAWAEAIVGASTPQFGAVTAHMGFCNVGTTAFIFSTYGNELMALAIMYTWPGNDVRDFAVAEGWYGLRRAVAKLAHGKTPATHRARPHVAKTKVRRRYRVTTQPRACSNDGRLVAHNAAEAKVFAKMQPLARQRNRTCRGQVMYARPRGGARAANGGNGTRGVVFCGLNGQAGRNRSGKKVVVHGSFACNAGFESINLVVNVRYQAKAMKKKTMWNPQTAGVYQCGFTKVGGTKGQRLVWEIGVFSFVNIGAIRVQTNQSHI